nr:hypothetical protein [Tanacetum cinerariifolium]
AARAAGAGAAQRLAGRPDFSRHPRSASTLAGWHSQQPGTVFPAPAASPLDYFTGARESPALRSAGNPPRDGVAAARPDRAGCKRRGADIPPGAGGTSPGRPAAAAGAGPLEKILGQQPAYQFFLRDQLEEVAADFDYVLIDTPPALTSLTYAALVASDAVFIPVQPEFYGYEGLTTLLDACTIMNKNFNPR